MSERDLELALRALGARLEGAPAPDLWPGVETALAGPGRPRPARRRRRLRVAVGAVVAALALATAAVAAAPSLRDEVRSWFADAGVRVETVGTVPATVPPSTIRDLRLGSPVTAAAATRLLGAPPPSSPVLGPPDALLAAAGGAGPLVTLVWAPRARLPGAPSLPDVGALLTISPARDPGDPYVLGKSLPPGTRVTFVSLGPPTSAEGVWIEGAPHAVTTLDGRTETFRLAANVLLWRRGDRVLRLESVLGREAATAIAGTLAGSG